MAAKKQKLNPLAPEDPATAGPDREACQKCGLFKDCTTPFRRAQVPVNWPGNLLVVTDLPGTQGMAQLDNWLREIDLYPNQVAYTYANRCQPLDNTEPNMVQVRACRPFLEWEIRALKPQQILGLGTVAARSLTNDGQAAVTRLRGRPLTLPKGDPA